MKHRKYWVIRTHDIIVRIGPSARAVIEREGAIAAYPVGSVDLSRIAA